MDSFQTIGFHYLFNSCPRVNYVLDRSTKTIPKNIYSNVRGVSNAIGQMHVTSYLISPYTNIIHAIMSRVLFWPIIDRSNARSAAFRYGLDIEC